MAKKFEKKKRTGIKAEELFLDEVPSVVVEEVEEVVKTSEPEEKKEYHMVHDVLVDSVPSSPEIINTGDFKRKRISLPGVIFNLGMRNKKINGVKFVNVSPVRYGEMEQVSVGRLANVKDERDKRIMEIVSSKTVPWILNKFEGKKIPSSFLIVGGDGKYDSYNGAYFSNVTCWDTGITPRVTIRSTWL